MEKDLILADFTKIKPLVFKSNGNEFVETARNHLYQYMLLRGGRQSWYAQYFGLDIESPDARVIAREWFGTKKEAIAWLEERHQRAVRESFYDLMNYVEERK